MLAMAAGFVHLMFDSPNSRLAKQGVSHEGMGLSTRGFLLAIV